MDADDLLVASAEAFITTVDTDMSAKQTQNAYNLSREQLIGKLHPDDAPGLLCPVEVVSDGKDLLGALLVLADRSILVWQKGMLRPKRWEVTIPQDGLEVTRGQRPAKGIMKARDTLTVKWSAGTHQIVFANIFDGGRNAVDLIAGCMTRAVYVVSEATMNNNLAKLRKNASGQVLWAAGTAYHDGEIGYGAMLARVEDELHLLDDLVHRREPAAALKTLEKLTVDTNWGQLPGAQLSFDSESSWMLFAAPDQFSFWYEKLGEITRETIIKGQ